MRIHDQNFQLFKTASQIHTLVSALAVRLNADFKDEEVTFVIVLKGAYIFAADLLRQIQFKNRVAFVQLSSYDGTSSTGNLHVSLPLSENICGKHVIVLEDIIETGLTMEWLLQTLEALHPSTLHVCTLLRKPDRFRSHFEVKYVGLDISDAFVIGYGFDYNEVGRNLPDLYQLDAQKP